MSKIIIDFGYATLSQIAERINEAPVQGFESHTPEYIAAAYAIQAQSEAGYEICENSADVHFDVLEKAGAKFNRIDALWLALA